MHKQTGQTGKRGESSFIVGSLTSADSPEEDVPWEGVFVAVGPGEEDEWFSVAGSVRMLV